MAHLGWPRYGRRQCDISHHCWTMAAILELYVHIANWIIVCNTFCGTPKAVWTTLRTFGVAGRTSKAACGAGRNRLSSSTKKLGGSTLFLPYNIPRRQDEIWQLFAQQRLIRIPVRRSPIPDGGVMRA